MRLSNLVIIAIALQLASCATETKKSEEVAKREIDPRVVELNNEVVDIISENLYMDTFDIDQLNQALEKIEKAIEIDSQYVYSYLNKATLLKTLGHYDHALLEYAKASKFQPNNAELIFSQGVIYENIGKLDSAQDKYFEAIRLYNKLIEDNPDSIDLKVNRAFVFLFTHDGNEALAQLSIITSKSDQDRQKIDLMENVIRGFDKEDFIRNF
ncbi:hypothetical protein [Ekhidna sp. To15]|uniref:hypothetical protein n=1 Tax=Ekhidna sp. To15 TaxID=3395267 RepID=UPI003F52532C